MEGYLIIWLDDNHTERCSSPSSTKSVLMVPANDESHVQADTSDISHQYLISASPRTT